MTDDLALLALRSALGVVFAAHGVRHLRGRARVVAWTRSIGFRAPSAQWAAMSGGEIAIGLGLLLGLLTPVAAAGAVAIVFVAYWTVHRRAGFWVTARPDEGWEYVFVLGAAALALAIVGPGGWSLDAALGWEGLTGTVGGAIALGGLGAGLIQVTIFFRGTS